MTAITQQVTEIMVTYHPEPSQVERPIIRSSEDAHKVLRIGYDPDTIALHESFVVAYLNRANRVLGLYKAHPVAASPEL